MKTFADKITELRGELAPPASLSEIAKLEERLKLALPEGLRNFLRQHNGSLKDTDQAIWKFWSCAEITTYSDYRNRDDFRPDNDSLREVDPSVKAVTLPGANLILFADALIDAPTYGVFHLLGHRNHGMVFDASMNYLSATCFEGWIAAFIEHGEDALVFEEIPKLEK